MAESQNTCSSSPFNPVLLFTAKAMTAPHSIVGAGVGYGRGFWVSTDGDHVWLEGMDAGVSVMTGFRRSSGLRYSVLSNTSGGVWPLAKLIHTR